MQINILLPPSTDQVMKHTKIIEKAIALRGQVNSPSNARSSRNAANRAKFMMLHHIGSKPIREIIYEKAQLQEIFQTDPSLPSIEIDEKCCGPQTRSHVFGFGGGLKANNLKGGTSSKAELFSALPSTREDNKLLNEENNFLNEENKSLNDRLSTLENVMKEIMKMKEFIATQ
uniref:Uncharacterized protein n=1 Tax=Solanum lycopersicum TaxID=4081 RepID=K4CD06_SOLLC